MNLRTDSRWVSREVVTSEKQQIAETGSQLGQLVRNDCDHGCGWRSLSQRAIHQHFLGLQVEDTVFFRVSDFTEGHPVEAGVFWGHQEEQ